MSISTVEMEVPKAEDVKVTNDSLNVDFAEL